jgi:transposase-like protein
VAETDLFKWRHYESEIILLCVRWYLRYALSYRDLEATVLKVKQKVAWRADAKPHYP